MRRLSLIALAALALWLVALSPAATQGIFAPGEVYGNGTSANRAPTHAPIANVMAQGLCLTNDSVPYVSASAWGCLGLLGTAHSWSALQTFTGHVAVEGVTSTGATGTGNFVFAASPSLSGVTVTGSFTATGLVTNADLANSSMTVNGTVCQLGFSCSPSSTAASATVGTTTILSGTTTRVLFDNAGVLGEYVITGTGNVVMSASPTLSGTVAGTITLSGNDTFSGNITHSGTSLFTGAIFTFGANGQAAVGASATAGGIFGGQGSTSDFSLENKSGQIVASNPTGTQTLNINTLTLTNTLSATYLPTATSAALGVVKYDNVTIQVNGSGQLTAVGSAATTITVGTTTITSGTSGRILYDNVGVLGEATMTGSLGSVVLSSSPTISAPTISGHPTVEGVTSTGATGTGNFAFSAAPTFTGTVNVFALTASDAITGNVTPTVGGSTFTDHNTFTAGTQVGGAAGSHTSPACTTTNLIFYSNNCSSNWAGTGVDTAGDVMTVTPADNFWINDAGTQVMHLTAAGSLFIIGTYNTSDARLKNIAASEQVEGLSLLLKLNPVRGTWKDPRRGMDKHSWLLAQDVRPLAPDLVANSGNDNHGVTPDGELDVNYSGLVPSMVQAFHDVDARLKKLEAAAAH